MTVIVPCFNEKSTILQVLDDVQDLALSKVVLVVDNNSTDGTRELLRAHTTPIEAPASDSGLIPTQATPGQEWRKGVDFLVLLQPSNLGKGASVRAGLAVANSKYFICQDADREYCPADILRLVAMAERNKAGAVFGSRLLATSPRHDSYYWGRVAMTVLFRCLYGTRLTDVATCYKLVRLDIARDLGLVGDGFSLDFEIAARLQRAGVDITELPVGYRPRTEKEGKKLRWRHGLFAAWTLLKLRLAPQPARLHF